MADEVTGKLKEAEGKLTGDEAREAQGKGEQVWDKVKDRADDIIDDIKDRFDGEDEKDKKA